MIKKSIEKLTTFSKPEDSPGYLLWHVSLAWRSLIEETLKPLNLTHPQFVVLATTGWLTRNGEHINQINISQASGLDPNTTSQVLRGLELKNFIKRTRSLNERSKNPELTDLGSKVLSKALPAVEKTDSHFFESLTAKEMEWLLKLFQKLSKHKTEF
jgi:MarR family transcriptional regulator, organic hydroperoxide resistance regulator